MISKMMSTMISSAILLHKPCQVYFFQCRIHNPQWVGSQGGMINLPSLLKRLTRKPPTEVIQAVCDLYGISPRCIASFQAEKLSVLSPFLWVITLNECARAIVVHVPGEMKQPVAEPWFDEMNGSCS